MAGRRAGTAFPVSNDDRRSTARRQSVSGYAIISGHAAAIYAPCLRPGRLSSPNRRRRWRAKVAGRSAALGWGRPTTPSVRQGSYSSMACSGSWTDRAMFVRIHYSRSPREKFAHLPVTVQRVLHTSCSLCQTPCARAFLYRYRFKFNLNLIL